MVGVRVKFPLGFTDEGRDFHAYFLMEYYIMFEGSNICVSGVRVLRWTSYFCSHPKVLSDQRSSQGSLTPICTQPQCCGVVGVGKS